MSACVSTNLWWTGLCDQFPGGLTENRGFPSITMPSSTGNMATGTTRHESVWTGHALAWSGLSESRLAFWSAYHDPRSF